VGKTKCREKEESLKVLHKEKGGVIWGKANPKDKGEQAFREHSRCIFTGRRKESKRDKDSREEAPGGQHVTRARSWWKRGDVSHKLPKPSWNAGCTKISSWTTIKHIKV
jgi:hypothetical protein